MKAPEMLTCSEWGARRPTHPPVPTGRPRLIVEHHTAGLGGPLFSSGSASAEAQAVAYAKALQADMMGRRGWADSGHSFLVMRTGIILQGRWGTISQIEQGRMVVSAHCPGENDQPGIEHEHSGGPMPSVQLAASARLQAWICWHTGIRPTQLFGHNHFYPTACPGELAKQVPELRGKVATILTAERMRGET